ncbi:MAG: TlpA family protein disulfide reductase [Cyclobacteriaceae bacterium]|nr:TlpA family protein disulfide reductase [Cyclobacteriaceae bacterium]
MKTTILSTIIIVCFAAQSVAQTATLKEGDLAPELLPFKWLRGKESLNWGSPSFHMIEFGATWCKPCAAAIPELITLQKDFQDQLTIVSVFVMEGDAKKPEYIPRVQRYISKRGAQVNYTMVADWPDGRIKKNWLEASNQNGIPSMFIVDREGKIVWIGASPEKARAIIEKLVKGESARTLIAAEKPQYPHDLSKLLLIDDNGGAQESFLFRSLLTKYNGGMRGNGLQFITSHRTLPDELAANRRDKLEIIGFPIERMYYMAYGDTLALIPRERLMGDGEYPDTVRMPHTRRAYGRYWHNAILEVSDSRPFEYSWKYTGHRYNYSLKVPKGMGSAELLQQTLQRDLATYFGYDAEVQVKKMPYWKISVADDKLVRSKLISLDQSMTFSMENEESSLIFKHGIMLDVVNRLGSTYGFGPFDYGKMPVEEQAAFTDETGIQEKIDFNFNRDWTFEECQKYFLTIGLNITKAYRNMNVVVIKDASN